MPSNAFKYWYVTVNSLKIQLSPHCILEAFVGMSEDNAVLLSIFDISSHILFSSFIKQSPACKQSRTNGLSLHVKEEIQTIAE